jgi:hypothetical protein
MVESNNFQQMSQAELERLLASSLNQMTELSHRSALRAEDAVKQPFYDGFVCRICQSVVEDARQCKNCDNLFCSACIQQWLQTKNSCPVCRTSTEIANMSVHPIVQSKLNLTKFVCQQCCQIFEYRGKMEHFCQPKALNCPVPGCSTLV